MTEQSKSSGEHYTYILLAQWTEVVELGEKFRAAFIGGTIEQVNINLYLAKLTRLWLELSPMMEGRTDLGDLPIKFQEFSVYYYNPKKLSETGNYDKIFQLEAILRKALEKLGITRFSQ
jgi:hypothetical protein